MALFSSSSLSTLVAIVAWAAVVTAGSSEQGTSKQEINMMDVGALDMFLKQAIEKYVAEKDEAKQNDDDNDENENDRVQEEVGNEKSTQASADICKLTNCMMPYEACIAKANRFRSINHGRNANVNLIGIVKNRQQIANDCFGEMQLCSAECETNQ